MIQIYTGDGKGKTTAAIGQGIRFSGYKKQVYMIQFLKGNFSGELESLNRLEPFFKIFEFEKHRDFLWNLKEEDVLELKKEIRGAFNFVKDVIKGNKCDMLILDEFIWAINEKFINLEETLELFSRKDCHIELVLTGRNAPRELIEIADYVSRIECEKHPYKRGIMAREGIEY